MTKRELNRDVNRLRKKVIRWRKNSNCIPQEEDDIQKEYRRLYMIDQNFEWMSKKSVLTMLRINLLFRFTALHHFGIEVELENL